MITTRLSNIASAAGAKLAAARSVDLSSATQTLDGVLSTAREIASAAREKVADRVSHPGDAYDTAIDNMVAVAANIRSIDEADLEGLVAAGQSLKDENPFR